MLKNNLFTILFISWTTIITSLSLFSFPDLNGVSPGIPHIDKIAHFGFYAMFVVLGCLFLREQSKRSPSLKNTIRTLLLTAFVYGTFIEVLQYVLTEDRMAQYGDVAANMLGAVAGALSIWGYFSKKAPLKWKI